MSTDKKNEVNSFWLDQDLTKNYTLGWYAYGFSINTSIHPEQFDKVKKAILSALNDTVVEDKGDGIDEITKLKNYIKYLEAEFECNKDKVYTLVEVDAIRADTWYAARKITDKVVGEIDFKDGDRCPFYEKYFNSINDYLSSLNLNSNDTGKEAKFKLGDVVIHKAGGLPMTCDGYKNETEVKCQWFDKAKRKFGVFHEDVLKFYIAPEQPTNDNAFVWTDALVLLLCDFCHHNGYHKFDKRVVDEFDEFKEIPCHKRMIPDWIKKHIATKQSAPEPSALPNKEWKEWKIVDIMDDNGQIISNPSTDIIHMVLKHRGERIHSVRRESDKEIFTIGDKISWGCTGVYETTLTAFEIKNNRLKFYYDKLPENANPCDFLDAINLYKLPTPTQPVVEDKPTDSMKLMKQIQKWKDTYDKPLSEWAAEDRMEWESSDMNIQQFIASKIPN